MTKDKYRRVAVYTDYGELVEISDGRNEEVLVAKFEATAEYVVVDINCNHYDIPTQVGEYELEASQWYGADGVFEMKVNFVTMKTAIAMFGAALKSENSKREKVRNYIVLLWGHPGIVIKGGNYVSKALAERQLDEWLAMEDDPSISGAIFEARKLKEIIR